MSESEFRPKARERELLIEPIGEELLVFDERSRRAHSLNRIAAEVWLACDGTRKLAELQLVCGLDGPTIELALERLRTSDLLEQPAGADQLSRRVVLRRGAIAGAGLGIAVPIIRSITAPSLAMASSHHKGKATLPCTTSADCSPGPISNCSDQGSGSFCFRDGGQSCFANSSCGTGRCISGICTGCFVPSTEVLMADGGRLPIGRLRIGDLVLAGDEQTGVLGARPVAQVFNYLVDELLVLGLDNGSEIRTTRSHPFATPGGNFLAAGELAAGAVLPAHGPSRTLQSATRQVGRHEVLNLEVEGMHTYFVGDERLWVHNKALSRME